MNVFHYHREGVGASLELKMNPAQIQMVRYRISSSFAANVQEQSSELGHNVGMVDLDFCICIRRHAPKISYVRSCVGRSSNNYLGCYHQRCQPATAHSGSLYSTLVVLHGLCTEITNNNNNLPFMPGIDHCLDSFIELLFDFFLCLVDWSAQQQNFATMILKLTGSHPRRVCASSLDSIIPPPSMCAVPASL